MYIIYNIYIICIHIYTYMHIYIYIYIYYVYNNQEAALFTIKTLLISYSREILRFLGVT